MIYFAHGYLHEIAFKSPLSHKQSREYLLGTRLEQNHEFYGLFRGGGNWTVYLPSLKFIIEEIQW